jgi:hypothetical protein
MSNRPIRSISLQSATEHIIMSLGDMEKQSPRSKCSFKLHGTALRVQAEHQAVTVNAVRPKHAAGGDLAETGEHLVQIFDEVAHVGYSWRDVKLKACMEHYSCLGAEIKKPRNAWLWESGEID